MRLSWRLVAGFAICGAALTLLVSLSNNPVGTSFMRSLYALLAFSALGAVVQIALSVLLRPAATADSMLPPDDEEQRGARVDYTTPDDPFDDTVGPQGASDGAGGGVQGFQPLQPKRVVSLDNPDPEAVVQAIRRLTDD